MTTEKPNSALNRKMASPRGCVAFSALDALRSVVSLLRRLLRTQQASPAKLVLAADDLFRDPFWQTGDKEGNFVDSSQEARIP